MFPSGSNQELWWRAKKAKDPIEKTRFLALYHAKRTLTAKETARITHSVFPLGSNHTSRWVYATVQRYNQQGPEAHSVFP